MGWPLFDEHLRSFEDWDFELRLIAACEVLICPARMARIRRFDDGTRTDRAVPGQLFTHEQAMTGAARERYILRRVLARSEWSEEERAALTATLCNVEAQLATQPIRA